MSAKVTTMKALIQAIQDESSTEAETIAALTHVLSRRGLVLAGQERSNAQLTKAFF